MGNRWIVVALLFAASFPAGASSEFFHQSNAGSWEFTADLNSKYEITRFANGAKSEGFDGIVSLQSEYGWKDNWALGVWVGLGLSESKEFGSDEESAGLEDLELYFKSYRPLFDGRLRYGGALQVALDDATVDQDNFRNRFTGGIWAKFFVGYEHQHGPHVLGVRLSQEIGLEERLLVSDLGGETDVEGEEEFEMSFFIEKPKENESYWGGSFSYVIVANRIDNGFERELTSPIIRFQAYRPSNFRNGKLIPRLSMATSLTERVNSAELDEFTEVQLGASYRF